MRTAEFQDRNAQQGCCSQQEERKKIKGTSACVKENFSARRPELITELSQEFGSQAVVLAIDARRRVDSHLVRARHEDTAGILDRANAAAHR